VVDSKGEMPILVRKYKKTFQELANRNFYQKLQYSDNLILY